MVLLGLGLPVGDNPCLVHPQGGRHRVVQVEGCSDRPMVGPDEIGEVRGKPAAATEDARVGDTPSSVERSRIERSSIGARSPMSGVGGVQRGDHGKHLLRT